MTALLTFRDVSFTYRNAAAPALENLDLAVTPGTVTVVLGPNGTGKSTLLHLATGWLRPTRGTVLFDGRPLPGHDRRELGRSIALVPQAERTPFDYTVLDHVVLGRAPHLPIFAVPSDRDQERARQAIDRVGLSALRHRSVSTLSGGELQLTLIARALAQEPRLLLMDEPTAHLDLAHKARVIDLVRAESAAGGTVILSTHEPDVAAAVATHVVLVRRGRVHRCGPLQEIFTADHLTATYGLTITLGTVDQRPVVLWAPHQPSPTGA